MMFCSRTNNNVPRVPVAVRYTDMPQGTFGFSDLCYQVHADLCRDLLVVARLEQVQNAFARDVLHQEQAHVSGHLDGTSHELVRRLFMSFISTASRSAAACGVVGGAYMTGSTVAHQLQLVGYVERPAALETWRVPAVQSFILDPGVGSSLTGPFRLGKTHERLALVQIHVVGTVERIENLSDKRTLYAVHAALHDLGVGAVAYPDLTDNIEAPRGPVLRVGHRLPGAVPEIPLSDGPGCNFAWVGVLGRE